MQSIFYQKNMNISENTVSTILQGYTTSPTMNSPVSSEHESQKIILMLLYSLVFAGGSVGAIVLSQKLLKTRSFSVTTTAVINLVVVHSMFLIVVPFRISYYVMGAWKLPSFFCTVVSAMLPFHMYTAFGFYVAILIIRFLTFFKKNIRVYYCKQLHSLIISTVVWTIVIVLILPLIIQLYKNYDSKKERCFEYHVKNYDQQIITVNYFIIISMILAMTTLMIIQIIILAKVVMKFKKEACSHQEFRAQVKTFLFVLAMLISFLPYHIFRIYYISEGTQPNSTELYFYNEFCSGLTAISCLDSLVILAVVSLSKRQMSFQ
ncbi:probable G-protein coupled receptor 141 isoform X2 [Protopterus annectens]|uniref:probable G-protein coupled receptor 141 isoform X2 n=1 Tax=Protopterus annectens TaxID=7888 RepID=UPI001CF995B7|nr:probable G-protein coupled receptor 141 isoform X2 [Protopterus annectens]